VYAPAAYPDESYLEMGLRALERWRAIEVESGEQLLWPTGALTVGDFAERELPALREAGVEAQPLSVAVVMKRFGVRISDEWPLLYQPDAGVIAADRALAALLRLAREAGVELHDDEPVRSIEEGDPWVEVVTTRRRFRCAAAIVAAGPWSGELLARAGIDLPLSVSCQSISYFALADPSVKPIAVMEFDGDEPYALWDPERGLKAALHARGPTVNQADSMLDTDPSAVERLTDWVAERYPRVAGHRTAVEPCFYTNAPGERFILERRGRIVLAAACNGQGFQFAPETGERLAELALEPAKVATR